MQKCSMKKLHRDRRGFTLLEILVAFAILAIVVTPIFMAFMTTTRFNQTVKVKEQANSAATNEMESVKAQGAEVLIAKTGADAWVPYDKDANVVSPHAAAVSYYKKSEKVEIDGQPYLVVTKLKSGFDENTPEGTTPSSIDEITDYNKTSPISFPLKGRSHIANLKTGKIDMAAAEAIAKKAVESGDTGVTADSVYNSNIDADAGDDNACFHKEVFIDINVEKNAAGKDVYVVRSRCFYSYQELADPRTPLGSGGAFSFYTNGSNRTYRYCTVMKEIFRGTKDVNTEDKNDLQEIDIINTSIPIKETNNTAKTAEMFTINNRTQFPVKVKIYQTRDQGTFEGKTYNKLRMFHLQKHMQQPDEHGNGKYVFLISAQVIATEGNKQKELSAGTLFAKWDWWDCYQIPATTSMFEAASSSNYYNSTGRWGWETFSRRRMTIPKGTRYRYQVQEWYYWSTYENTASEDITVDNVTGIYTFTPGVVRYLIETNTDGATVSVNYPEFQGWVDRLQRQTGAAPTTGCYPVPLLDACFVTGATVEGDHEEVGDITKWEQSEGVQRVYSVEVTVYSWKDVKDETTLELKDGAKAINDPLMGSAN